MIIDLTSVLRQAARIPDTDPYDTAVSSREFMPDYFRSCEGIQTSLGELAENIAVLNNLRANAAASTNTTRDKEISKQLESLLSSTSALVNGAKDDIKEMRTQNVKICNDKKLRAGHTNTQLRIRNNLQVALARRLRDLIGKFQEAEATYKAQVQAKAARQLQIVFPDASLEEVDEMAKGDMDTSQVIQSKMQGTHVSVQDALGQIQSKYLSNYLVLLF